MHSFHVSPGVNLMCSPLTQLPGVQLPAIPSRLGINYLESMCNPYNLNTRYCIIDSLASIWRNITLFICTSHIIPRVSTRDIRTHTLTYTNTHAHSHSHTYAHTLTHTHTHTTNLNIHFIVMY